MASTIFLISLVLRAVSTVTETTDGLVRFSTYQGMMESKPAEVPHAVVLLYDSSDEKCTTYIKNKQITQILSELTRHSEHELGVDGLFAVELTDAEYIKKLKLKMCPNLLLLRNNIPILYDGDNLHINFNRDDIGEWIQNNIASVVNELNDVNFEHHTQASTGATTGDWLIWFHRDECSDLKPIWEAVASRIRHTKVTGEVNISENPQVVKRFKLKNCEDVYLFRHGKMYLYSADIRTVRSLINFAETSYQNSPSQFVKPMPSPFEEITDCLTNYIKESDYGLYILVGVTFLLFGTILYLVIKESKELTDKQKTS